MGKSQNRRKTNTIELVLDKATSIGVWISAGTIIFIMLFVSADVISRVLFKKSFSGGTEAIVCMLTVWTGYFALAHTTKIGGHVALTILPSALKGKAKLIDSIIIELCTFAFMVIMTYATFKYGFLKDFTANTIIDSSFSFKLRLWWAEIAMPIGCCLLIFVSLMNTIKNIYALTHSEAINRSEEVAIK